MPPHPDDIESLYTYMVKAITCASKALPQGTYNEHSKPYWSATVKTAHNDQRRARKLWVLYGQARSREDAYLYQYKKSSENLLM